jgi:hypothetical protein
VGHLAGTVVGLALALAGVGVWSLLAIRLVGRFSTMLLLVSASPVRIFPRFSLPHLRELSGFAGWSFGSRVVDTITDAVFQALVTRFFGLVGVGYLNMALRIIEPVRGATGSIGHNIAMSFFVRAQDAPKKLRNLVSQTITGTAIVMLPIFIGLAAAGPSIIEVIAGPDWQPSAVLVVLLALGAAITCSTNFHHTGLVAKGRAELAFISSVLEFSVMVCALWLLSGWGLVAAGVARFVAFAVDANYAVLVARKVLNIRARTNAPFDRMFEWAAPGQGPALGAAGPVDGVATLTLDDPRTEQALQARGLPLGATSRGRCHWSFYTRPGTGPLYAALLDQPGIWTADRIAALSDEPAPAQQTSRNAVVSTLSALLPTNRMRGA